ncbi:hypothetical protein [Virgibacillus ihumii]|uniref:hypothetical protein n=1 Tax=Virgibacillus ihumii TaxID=2686091 RepID=UPI00157D470C|nr:hypothetical protein [Virgibacillus ihumii]
MKKSNLLLLFVTLVVVVLVTACGSGGDSESSKEENEQKSEQASENEKENNSASLDKGIEKVLTSLHELKNTIESSPGETGKINSNGKTLSESWEPIEKKIEERNPDAYENIEKSLYPLIGEAQKENPDTNKLTKLIKETNEKLNQFKDKVSSS